VISGAFWLFCGLGSGTIAFTLQIYAQKYLHPVSASLLMSFESVFAVIGGWLFLNEQLSKSEITGCTIILAAIIIAQLPPVSVWRKKNEKKILNLNSVPIEER
jgi:drug/metabolite transporter (DMT)-like permease